MAPTGPTGPTAGTRTLVFVMGHPNAAASPTVGFYAPVRSPVSGTIVKATIIGDQTGSAVVDIEKSTYANFPTTASICASAKPTLSSTRKAEDATITGWTTAITAGDVLIPQIDSASTLKQVTVMIDVAVS